MKKAATYHHGDLRSALIEETLSAVRRNGTGTFSLRLAAQATGVTPGAVYRHFANKEALLDAVAIRGFRQLAELTRTRMDGKSGADKIVASGMAYIEFAESEPQLFNLMFGADGAVAREQAANTNSEPISSSERIKQAMKEHMGKTPSEQLYLHAWGLAHGLASLAANGVLKSDSKAILSALRSFAESLPARAS